MYKAFVGALGALFSFLILGGIYYWWDLLKMYRRYKKGVDEMSETKFYIFLALNFIILGFVTLIVLATADIDFSRESEFLNFIIPLAIASFISYLLFRQYKRIKKNNNDTITKKEEFTLDDNDNK